MENTLTKDIKYRVVTVLNVHNVVTVLKVVVMFLMSAAHFSSAVKGFYCHNCQCHQKS